MRNTFAACELFRVPTCEILEELRWRSYYKTSKTLTNYSSKELLKFILSERIDAFHD